MEFVQQTQQRVLSGEIVGELIKPVPLSQFLLAQEIGRYMSRLLLRTLPIAIFIYFTFGLTVPHSPLYIALFVASIIFSFWIMFGINYITALAAFWITQLFSVNVLKGQSIRLLSGILVPLWFFPVTALPIIKLLPFASIAFVPIQLFLEDITLSKACYSLALQLAWGVIIWQIGRWMWSKAVRQLSINGG
jgi:ABC-2 type transport system permease protein